MLVQILNRLIRPELSDGELGFLNEQVMLIEVADARLRLYITLANGQLKAVPKESRKT